MTGNKNARPTAATVGQANGNAASNFQTHFTVSGNGNQSEISGFLGKGKANAVSLRKLRLRTGLDERTIRQKITAERLKGIPILADNQTGYFLPATEEERNRCVQSMKHRAKYTPNCSTMMELYTNMQPTVQQEKSISSSLRIGQQK